VYPESTRIRPKELQAVSARIGWFGFATGGIKGDSIHCMFILSMEDNMMLGSYHFPEEGMEENRKILIEMLKSIRLEEKTPMERQGVRNEAGI